MAAPEQKGFLRNQVLSQQPVAPEHVAGEIAFLHLHLRAFGNLEDNFPVARLATLQQLHFDKVVALVFVLLLNPADGLLIGHIVKRAASLQSGPRFQMLQLHLFVADVLHPLHNRTLFDLKHQHVSVGSLVDAFLHIEKPAGIQQRTLVFTQLTLRNRSLRL